MSRIQKVLMALVVILALPLILPVELYCRLIAPEHRWSAYPAFHEVFQTRYARTLRENP